MKKLVVGIYCGLLLVSLPLSATSTKKVFSFSDDEVILDSARQEMADKLFALIQEILANAAVESATLGQMPAEEVSAWQHGFTLSGGEAWLSGCSVKSDLVSVRLSSKLTPELLSVLTVPLNNGETAFEIFRRSGNMVLAETIRRLCMENPR